MKTFYIKKAKGTVKPVIGASVSEKKPSVGSYINFNVGTEIKYEATLEGAFNTSPLTGNMTLEADSVEVVVETIGGGGVEYSWYDVYFSMPEYGGMHTVDQLIEMVNRRAGGMVHFVLENNKIYLTKNGFTSDIASVSIDATAY